MARTLSTPLQLGAAIRDARTRRGMTQEELASAAGVSRRWLINLESGRGGRSEIAMVMATAQALELTLTLSPASRADLTTTEQQLLEMFEDD